MPTPAALDALDKTPFVGLAVTNVHTGYNASIEFTAGIWSPQEFAVSASEAILKALKLHAPAPEPEPKSQAAPKPPSAPPLPY